jgi:hypothetical protein
MAAMVITDFSSLVDRFSVAEARMRVNTRTSSHSDLSLGVVISMTLFFLVGGVPAVSAGVLPTRGWVPAWTASPQEAAPKTIEYIKNRTLRLIVHTTVGGSQVRIRLSNTFGGARS